MLLDNTDMWSSLLPLAAEEISSTDNATVVDMSAAEASYQLTHDKIREQQDGMIKFLFFWFYFIYLWTNSIAIE